MKTPNRLALSLGLAFSLAGAPSGALADGAGPQSAPQILPVAYALDVAQPTYLATLLRDAPTLPPTYVIEVRATAISTNPCMVPDQIAREVEPQEAGNGMEHNVRVLGVNATDRLCTLEFNPIRREIMIDRFTSNDGMPVIKVNGQVAVPSQQ